MRRIWHAELLLAGVLLAACAAYAEKGPKPLVRAYAHNDYAHKRPLFDALDHGFCGVEADIYLLDGALLVAHDRDQCRPDRTLEALYLEPLRERVKTNGGRVYPNGPGFMLMIDIKSDGRETYAVLHKVLEGYAEMLTEFRGQETVERAVTALISGHRPIKTIAAQSVRYAAIDGRPPDLDRNPPQNLVPVISASWGSLFESNERGIMSEEDRIKLEEIVQRAHGQGRRIRFWALPWGEGIWPVIYDVGVDLINTDDLPALQEFLLTKLEEDEG